MAASRIPAGGDFFMRPGLRLLILASGVLLGGGCTSVKPFRGIPLDGDSLYVSGLPPIRQDQRYACGPACLAAVAGYWGVELEKFKATDAAAMRDSSGKDLQKLAEALGLRAFVFAGSYADLQDNLRQGRPVIVMLPKPPDPALRQAGLIGAAALALSEHVPHPPHWVVVVGLVGPQVVVHDPASGQLQIETPVFLDWWGRTGNLCVLVSGR